MLDNRINTIHTTCKDCVFSVYENKTQVSCALDYIDIYKKNNIEILEAYDNDKEFYIINNKKCIGYRENKWFKQFDLENADLNTKINKYFETNTLDYMVIINLKLLDSDQLNHILYQISSCSIKAKKIILIRHINDDLKFPYSVIEKLFTNNNISCVWRIQTIVDTELQNHEILNNIISLNSKYRFVLSISDYNNDIEHIISETNKIVHNNLDQFNIISNQNYTCLIFSSVVYRFEKFNGNNILKNIDNYKIV